jgi:hypothetical protein
VVSADMGRKSVESGRTRGCKVRWFLPAPTQLFPQTSDRIFGGSHGSWTTEHTWAPIAIFTDEPEIRRGLFPGVGGKVSSRCGGGKDFHYRVAEQLFEGDEKYGPDFAQAEKRD